MDKLLTAERATAAALVAPVDPEETNFVAEVAALRSELESLKANLATAPPALISLKEVCRITSLSRTAINQRRKAGTFATAVPLGDKRVAFVRAEVDAWIRARIGCRQREAA